MYFIADLLLPMARDEMPRQRATIKKPGGNAVRV
jgi:hypothetical protein